MAIIREYSSQVNPSTEVQTKQSSGISIGQGISHLAQGLEEVGTTYLDHNTKMQLTKGETLQAKNDLDLETQIVDQKQSFDPTDVNAQQKYMKGYEAAHQKNLEVITDPRAREKVEKQFEQGKEKYWKMALHRNATLQGQEAVAMVQERSNVDNQSVYLNPALLKDKLGKLSYMDNIPGAEAGVSAKLKNDEGKKLAISAMSGTIRDNPWRAKALLESKKGYYPNYLEGTEVQKLVAQADQSIRAKRVDAEHTLAMAEKYKKQEVEKVGNEFLQLQVKGQLSADRVVNDPILPFHVKKSFIDSIGHQAKGSMEADPTIKAKVFDQIMLPDSDPRKITDPMELIELQSKGLSPRDAAELTGYMNEMNSVKGQGEWQYKQKSINLARSKLVNPPQFGQEDKIGNQKYSQFITDFNNEFAAGIKAGKTPLDMLSEDSKDYITDKIIRKYAKTPAELVIEKNNLNRAKVSQDIIDRQELQKKIDKIKQGNTQMTDEQIMSQYGLKLPSADEHAENKRQPGESTAAFLKRMGK